MNIRKLIVEIGLMLLLFFGIFSLFPVLVHTIVFGGIILNLSTIIFTIVSGWLCFHIFLRYFPLTEELSMSVFFGSLVLWVCSTLSWFLYVSGLELTYLAQDSAFTSLETMPQMDIKRARYLPEQVASQEIVRRAQLSQFAPGRVSAMGTENGIVYIAPLVVQGVFNMVFEKNKDFMIYDDAATESERVTTIHTFPWMYGEGMEFLDNIKRQLILTNGFFHSYTSDYYAILTQEKTGAGEVVGVFPFLSYHIRFPGVFVPYWGGTVIVHANGTFETLNPQEALADPRFSKVHRLYPRTLARLQVEAQRFDRGWYSGYIRRDDKIEIPDLQGNVQMPFYLPMADGSYSYVTMVEPDGESFALRKIFVTDARSGVGSVYSVPTDHNILGPDKAMSYAKSIQGYNWYEEHGTDRSNGSYRVIEPRPVVRNHRLFYMYSIVPVDYASVVATVFIDAVTNEVAGPFKTREETFSWLQDKTVVQVPSPSISTGHGSIDFCIQLQTICKQVQATCPATP